ncbi:MAG: HIT domain-containing protein [Syntrophobacteraceae bacterium]|jgi:ATP adenylyltransferase|nr:HIT domain-containing protein [Syntrophobacteraceae bacterium]
MQNLWAPWRIDYILGNRESYCIFCPEGEGLTDEERLILHRGRLSMVMMNKYPYNNGHLLVAPWRHVSTPEALNPEEMLEVMHWVNRSVSVLRQVMKPDGFNIGVNLGTAAGAGVEDHVHFHIVPRWHGDTNFLMVVGEVRSIPEHLRQTYAKLLPHMRTEDPHESL